MFKKADARFPKTRHPRLGRFFKRTKWNNETKRTEWKKGPPIPCQKDKMEFLTRNQIHSLKKWNLFNKMGPLPKYILWQETAVDNGYFSLQTASHMRPVKTRNTGGRRHQKQKIGCRVDYKKTGKFSKFRKPPKPEQQWSRKCCPS